MRRAILSFGVGLHADLLDIAWPSFERFAELHGWELIDCNPEPGFSDRPPSWWKIPFMLEALNGDFDEVLWLGADTVIVDPSEDITMPAPAWQALVIHDTPDGFVPNADVWLVRPKMRHVLEQVWSMTQHIDSPWWEQTALVEMMGYVTSNRPIKQIAETALWRHTHILDPGWNVHRNDAQEVTRPRIMHATMHPDRAAVMSEWAELAKSVTA